jgi:hypothetical protein
MLSSRVFDLQDIVPNEKNHTSTGITSNASGFPARGWRVSRNVAFHRAHAHYNMAFFPEAASGALYGGLS